MEKKTCMEKFDSIVKGLSAKDKIALIHDLDVDGISSGAITLNALRLLTDRVPLVITQPYKTVELLPKTISILKKSKINKIVTVDFALDQDKKSIAMAEKITSKVLVIDHHKDYNPKGLKRTLIIKPQFFSNIEPSKYPTSKLCFDLFSRHLDMEKYSWIASVGLIGDNQLNKWKRFVQKSAKKHKSNITEFKKAERIITAVETLAPSKLNELLHLLAGASHPREIIKSQFSKYVSKLSKKVGPILKRFKTEKEFYPKQELVWFEYWPISNQC